MAVIELTDANFTTDVLEADKPVLVDYWASWCGPCRQIAPALAEIADEMAEDIHVGKMDIDANPETPGRYGVRGVPTLMLFRGSEILDTSVGVKSKSDLIRWIKEKTT